MTTTAPAQPLPVPMTPSFGAMSSARARSHTYCTGAFTHRYTSLPRSGCVSLATSTTLPSASATTVRWPWSPASRWSYTLSTPARPTVSPSSISRPSGITARSSAVTEPV